MRNLQKLISIICFVCLLSSCTMKPLEKSEMSDQTVSEIQPAVEEKSQMPSISPPKSEKKASEDPDDVLALLNNPSKSQTKAHYSSEEIPENCQTIVAFFEEYYTSLIDLKMRNFEDCCIYNGDTECAIGWLKYQIGRCRTNNIYRTFTNFTLDDIVTSSEDGYIQVELWCEDRFGQCIDDSETSVVGGEHHPWGFWLDPDTKKIIGIQAHDNGQPIIYGKYVDLLTDYLSKHPDSSVRTATDQIIYEHFYLNNESS